MKRTRNRSTIMQLKTDHKTIPNETQVTPSIAIYCSIHKLLFYPFRPGYLSPGGTGRDTPRANRHHPEALF